MVVRMSKGSDVRITKQSAVTVASLSLMSTFTLFPAANFHIIRSVREDVATSSNAFNGSRTTVRRTTEAVAFGKSLSRGQKQVSPMTRSGSKEGRGSCLVARAGLPSNTTLIFAFVFPLSLLVITVFNAIRIADKLDEKFLEEMYASQYFVQISELLRRLPRVILLMLKTNDCLRAVNHSLGSSLDTFLIIGRVSAAAVIETKMMQNKSFLSRVSIILEEMLLEAQLLTLHIASWLLQLRKLLSANM